MAKKYKSNPYIYIYMVAVTFIYRIVNNPKTFYGKCVYLWLSDDHGALDVEVKCRLLPCINKYQVQNQLLAVSEEEVKVGILSCSYVKNRYDYSSLEESQCFDFYYSQGDPLLYLINGEKIEM